MVLLNRIINKIQNICCKYKWLKDAETERRMIGLHDIQTSIKNGKKLILLPHVDDEWIGCSQVLLQSDDVTLCDMDMLGGDSIEIHQKRKLELHRLSELLQLPVITIGNNKINSLVEVIEETKCEQIFVPFFVDWHKEHLEVIDLLKSALKETEREILVVAYQVSLPLSEQNINVALPMSKAIWKKKWKIFKKIYPSQLHIPYKRFSLHEKINGAYVGAYAAEVFCVMDKGTWLKASSDYKISPAERECFLSNLNDISKVREAIRSYHINHNL